MVKGNIRAVVFFSLINAFFCAFLLCALSCAGSASAPEAAKDQTVMVLPEPESIPEQIQTEELPEHPSPAELVFYPAELPFFRPASEVGVLSGVERDFSSSLNSYEREALSASFRAAYVDALLRGQELAGVLGGDRVHGWPADDPSGWVQNWRVSSPRENSWGIPSLLLAVQSMEILREMAQDRVFLVQGDVLDHYGKSGGEGGANGSRGYGSPRGEEFFFNGSIAQRFELGLIIIDGEGKGRFVREAPPSNGKLAPEETGVFLSPPSTYGSHIRDAFLSAWKMAMDRNSGEMIPDGEGYYISFENDPWGLPAEYGSVSGAYVQSFNSGSRLLFLPDTSGLPPHVRLISYPFLDALLYSDRYALAGTEELEPLKIQSSAGGSFGRAILRGLSLYGLPLSDPMPKRAASAETGGHWQEAQRFSRGWLMSEAFVPYVEEQLPNKQSE